MLLLDIDNNIILLKYHKNSLLSHSILWKSKLSWVPQNFTM